MKIALAQINPTVGDFAGNSALILQRAGAARRRAPAAAQKPLGFCGSQVGLTICEDIWNDKSFWQRRLYARDPVEELLGQGSDFILNISASPFSVGKRTLRLEMVQALARRHRVPGVMGNQGGGDAQLLFDR